MSFELILPFLRPIAHLIQDPDISEIMVNGSQDVFVERCSVLQHVPEAHVNERNLKVAVKNIAERSVTMCPRSNRSSTHACRTALGLLRSSHRAA
jgi:type IV secretory pathway ATPase VirB11/archaellum biosynthesis ATPase